MKDKDKKFKFFISMLTGKSGNVSSKRFNGTILVFAGIFLGIFASIYKTQDLTLEVIKIFVYSGAILLGGGTLMENINFGGNKGNKQNDKETGD
jgi:hypothetical protein